jgi:hypothetical protein
VSKMNEIEMRGIDGGNLLGFLAALGVVRLLTKVGTRYLSALGSDCYPERKGELTPATTEFRAIGGGNNDGFLGLMRVIHTETKPEHLRSALFEDWTLFRPAPIHAVAPKRSSDRTRCGERIQQRTENRIMSGGLIASRSRLFLRSPHSLDGARSERRASRTAIKWPNLLGQSGPNCSSWTQFEPCFGQRKSKSPIEKLCVIVE